MKKIHSIQKSNDNQVLVLKNPMRKIYQFSITILTLLLLSLLLFSCSGKKKEASQNTTQPNVEESLKVDETMASAQNYEVVPNEKVCMVNDMFMGIDQLLVEVNGLNYYGCCEGCVEKLQENIDDVRFGSNPLTDTKVDKATAVIVQDKNNGSVFYFASIEEAKKFIK